MEPGAVEDFTAMNEACDHRIEYTGIYRSALIQIQSIMSAARRKRRLYAPPTKSGHQYGFSVDIGVDETLQNFKRSGVRELALAGRDQQALSRWMMRFGWTGIKKERWHFNHLDEHASTVKKIDVVHGADLALNNDELQTAMNRLLGKKLKEPLVIDGALGTKSTEAAMLTYPILGYDDHGEFSGWYRRQMAGVTVKIKEV